MSIANRYLDGSVSYVRSDWALGLGLVRRGARLVWERLRTVPGCPGDLSTDDRRVVRWCEVQRWVPLPVSEEMQGRLGCINLPALDRAHESIARKLGIAWEA
jgi:hypothetical protein